MGLPFTLIEAVVGTPDLPQYDTSAEGLSPLRDAAESVSAVVTLGEAAPEIEAVFAGLVPTRRAATIEEAVALAFVESHPGGEVILAPACASQDMFRDYAERGDQFAGAALALAAALAKHEEQSGADDG